MVFHAIVPPYLLEQLERSAGDPSVRARIRQSLQHDAVLRTRPAAGRERVAAAEGGRQRKVYDAENGTDLPGTLARSEGDDAVNDQATNQAYDGTGATWALYKECYGRDSIDGAGLVLTSTVHYDRGYANAFWDGAQMVFGDGDGEIFGNFTASIDVTGHELTHGVTQYTANLAYEGQSGALNESVSDVFGSLAKQRALGQSAADADWLIGAGLFLPGVQGVALRSMKAPGTAYDDPRLGKDPQPADMSGYVDTADDNGGVHINSGIPNRAFYLVAVELGGNAYDDAGKIWYSTLTSGSLLSSASFKDFAAATEAVARDLFGDESPQLAAVTKAWQTVGVLGDQTSLMNAAQTNLETSTPPAAPPDQQPPDQQSAEQQPAGQQLPAE